MTAEPKSDDLNVSYGMLVELSDREIYLIGRIVVLWGSLEFQVFSQTANTYTDEDQLPKDMNNLQPSKVLELWKRRVVDIARGRRKKKLEEQYAKIKYYSDFRHDIVHGMWDWSRQSPDRVSVIRVRKNELRTTHFTADDLESLVHELESINFSVSYPGDIHDIARERMRTGGFMSRTFFASAIGHPVADELMPPMQSRDRAPEDGRDQ